MNEPALDCVTIGYYEPPFEEYERTIRQLGEDSEAYRDIRFSFVEVDGQKMTYAGLLSHVYDLADGRSPGTEQDHEFKSGDIPSLAAVYLTNYLRARGLEADYVNLFLHEKDRLRSLLERGARCVAITTTFYGLNDPVIEMIETIRETDPEVEIVVGGPLVANHKRRFPPDELLIALEDIGADIYVIESQGELTLSRVVEALKSGGDLGEIPNIVYRGDSGELVATEPDPEKNSLNENFIDWTRFETKDLGATLQTRTARSCAFNCAFCAYPTRAGKLTLASVETIEQELDAMAAIGGVENVVFIDDTFNVPLPRFKEICRLMIRKQYGFNWFSYFRCSNSDDEAIELMAESGCKGVFLGIESGSPRILKNMNKHAAADQYREGIHLLKKNGILTFASFITGFPGETAETVQETIDFLQETKPDYFRSQIWYCEPGTPIWFKKDEYGIEGEGFRWEHDTMDSLEAMDHIDRMFLQVQDSRWLPQWSFDFWIIPYLMGKGMSLEQFASFMDGANRLLSLDIASLPDAERNQLKQRALEDMVRELRGWRVAA